jgi:hypothetical protein
LVVVVAAGAAVINIILWVKMPIIDWAVGLAANVAVAMAVASARVLVVSSSVREVPSAVGKQNVVKN